MRKGYTTEYDEFIVENGEIVINMGRHSAIVMKPISEERKTWQGKVAVLNDLAGFGRCSLTAAISVLSAMGVQPCPSSDSRFECTDRV